MSRRKCLQPGSCVPSSKKRKGNRNDLGPFVMLHWVVMDSPGYRRASHTARSLLLDIARQYTGKNNGRLTASAKYLKPLGWTSNDTIARAKRELVDCGLLVETRKGARPNKAAWYALTWRVLDQVTGLDIDPTCYRRHDYMQLGASDRDTKNAALAPSHGAGVQRIAPAHGVRPSIYAPPDGAVRGCQ